MSLSIKTSSLLALVFFITTTTAQEAWPKNKKNGCVLKNKKHNFTELTTVCSSDDVQKHCSTTGDPAKCSACSVYDDASKVSFLLYKLKIYLFFVVTFDRGLTLLFCFLYFFLNLQPFPALTQCYKFNQKACCTSGHDATIKDSYSSLLSNTCLREFPNLEYFYCLGCSDKQTMFVDIDRKEIHVCSSFAKKLWDDVDYDRCGLSLGDASWPYVLPRIEYSSATEFLNQPSIKPPYFQDYKIVVDEGENTDNCFHTSMATVRATVSTMAILLMSLLFSSLM